MRSRRRFVPIDPAAIVRVRRVRMPADFDVPDLEGALLEALEGSPPAVRQFVVTQYHFAWCCPHPRGQHRPAPPDHAVICHGCYPLPFAGHPYSHQAAYCADFAWPAARLIVECEGGIYTGQAHGSVGGILRDIEKHNAATLLGWRVLRVTGKMIEDGTAVEMIEQALGIGAQR